MVRQRTTLGRRGKTTKKERQSMLEEPQRKKRLVQLKGSQ